MTNNNEKNYIDLGDIFKTLWTKRKKFYIVWAVTFVLSCIWIFPQPRYYDCTVMLAPESSEASMGGLAGLASSVGLNIGSVTDGDALYPILYPDLLGSPEFIVNLMKIKVTTYDESISTDYYTYLNKHKKKNVITEPFNKLSDNIKKLFTPAEPKSKKQPSEGVNPFKMSKEEADIANAIEDNIKCNVDKKTNVITLTVRDQDRMVCALLADSIKTHLQNFIIDYRTKKARNDEKYYKHLADSARMEYEKAVGLSSGFQDSHRKSSLDATISYGEKLKSDLAAKQSLYNTFNTQYQAARAKVQERTPMFTTLKSATIPQKPSGPKRVIFVIGMCLFATVITAFWLTRKILIKKG